MINVQINRGGDDGQGGVGGSGAGGPSGEPVGACDNDSDLQVLASAGGVRDVARDCGILRCSGAIGDTNVYEACVEACIENDVQGISTECAGCYGEMERCGFESFCQLRCQSNTCSPMCLSCLNDAGCTEEFEACRGLTGSECTD